VPKTISIPHLFSNVDYHHQEFQVGYAGFSGYIEPTIIIPEGQYSATELVTQINTMIDTLLTTPGDLAISYNSTTNMFSWTEVGNHEAGVRSSLHGFMNLIGGVANIDIAQGGTTTMPYLPNLGGPNHIFVHSRRLAPGNMVTGTGRQHAVLDVVSLADTVYGGVVTKETDDVYIGDIDYRCPEEISTIDFYLTDSLMRPLTLPPTHPVHIILKMYYV